MDQEYADDPDWIEAFREAVRDEKDFQEGKKLKDNNVSVSKSRGKRQCDKPMTAKATKKPKYTAKENRVNQAKKKEEKLAERKAAPRQKIRHRVWGDAHTGIDQKVVDERKAQGQCTRCTMTNQGWKHWQKEIRVNTIHRKSFKLLRGRLSHPKPKKQRVAAVPKDSMGETSQQGSQRPLGWTFMQDEEL